MRRCRGFTLIELMVAVAIATILATLAAPSFTSFIASQRIKGLSNEITTDLAYAKMEAVQRNAVVTVAFSATGYSITSGGGTIKNVVLSGNNTFAPTTGTTYVSLEFDPVRAMATFADAAETGSLNISNSNASSISLRILINRMGRSQICSPSGSISGYTSC